MTATVKEEVSEDVQFEDLPHYWLNNGLPVFFANRDNICDLVENFGFSMYYLLANRTEKKSVTSVHPTTKVSSTVLVETETMQLFKVTNNAVGRVVQVANDCFDDSFLHISEECVYTMPPIPYEMVDKLDQFFRLVDAQHDSESIVLLTFDESKKGSEGWGIFVPDQVNNSVHCKYDPASVAAEKPEHVTIVGSVHSHPDMPAYASGTDHSDQADFDGIHITFGWQKAVNNGATQYHCEMQMQGQNYILQVEDVFENRFTDGDIDPEVMEWTSKVKKAQPPIHGGHRGLPSQTGGTGTETKPASTGTGDKFQDEVLKALKKLRERLETSFNTTLPANAIIMACVEYTPVAKEDQAAGWCPSCGTFLEDFNFFSGYCDSCYIPVIKQHSSADETLIKIAYYCNDLKVSPDAPLYLWEISADGTDSLMLGIDNIAVEIADSIARDQIHADMFDVGFISDNADFVDVGNPFVDVSNPTDDPGDRMLCCGWKISETPSGWCQCSLPVYPEDMTAFEAHTKSVYIYDSDAKCNTCQHFYSPTCRPYVDLAAQYAIQTHIPSEYFVGKIGECAAFEEYSYSGDHRDGFAHVSPYYEE